MISSFGIESHHSLKWICDREFYLKVNTHGLGWSNTRISSVLGNLWVLEKNHHSATLVCQVVMFTLNIDLWATRDRFHVGECASSLGWPWVIQIMSVLDESTTLFYKPIVTLFFEDESLML